jgi:hypothetical protein
MFQKQRKEELFKTWSLERSGYHYEISGVGLGCPNQV